MGCCRFCFYTVPDSLLDVQPEAVQRSHFSSSVEELLSSESQPATPIALALLSPM